MDRAAPPAIRQALIEGGNWWAQAFDQAGYVDAFRVELLPEGVNPMDARYNIVSWVHRETRGWSTGTSVNDPRTGEIVRGVVQLGSLRDRQDKMIFEGLVGADRSGTGGEDDPDRLAYQRLRQLAAHEIGHALGIAHNFAASTFADRASVMDYPAALGDRRWRPSGLQPGLYDRRRRPGTDLSWTGCMAMRRGRSRWRGARPWRRTLRRRAIASSTTPTPGRWAVCSPMARCGTMARMWSPSLLIPWRCAASPCRGSG